MGLRALGPGKNIPDEVNVVIEVPAHSDPVKYEVDKETFAIFVDRFLSTAMHYPCNYGYVPQTLADDGDPLDVLVIAPHSMVSGSVVKVRPIGMLDMEDEKGGDIKLLAVPIKKLCPLYENVKEPQDLPNGILDMIQHFFEHYKDLEKNKWVKLREWHSADVAKAEVVRSVENYKKYTEGK